MARLLKLPLTMNHQLLTNFVLQLAQVPVKALLVGYQLLVGAAFDDMPFLQHDYLIRFADGGEAVRDDDRRAAFHQFFQSFLHQTLRFGV
jgi:hypothetical protein